MEKHNIDKLFSDKLAGHTPAVNPAHWSQMETLIQAQGNSGSWLWWMIGAGVVIVTSIGLGSNHYLGSSDALTLHAENSFPVKEAIQFKLVAESEVAGTIALDEVQIDTPDTPQYAQPISNTSDEARTAQIAQNTQNVENAQADKTQVTPDKSQEETLTAEEESREFSSPDETFETPDLSEKQSVEPPQPREKIAVDIVNSAPEKTAELEESTEVDENPDLKKSVTVKVPEKLASTIAHPVAEKTDVATLGNSPDKSVVSLASSNQRKSARAGGGLDFLTTISPTGDFANPIDPAKLWDGDLDLPMRPKGYKTSKWAIAASGGIYGSAKILSSDKGFLEEYIDKRSTEEQAVTTPSYGLEVAYTPGRWSLNTGFHLNSVAQEANYSPVTIEEIQITDSSYWEVQVWEEMIIDTIWDTTGNGGFFFDLDTLYITFADSSYVEQIDSSFMTSVYEFEQNLKTTHQFLEIPLFAGYTVPLGQKGTKLGVYGGVSVVILRTTSGSYIGQGLDELQLIQKKNTNVGLDLMARLRLTQSLGYRTSIFAEGRYRHGLGSISSDQNYLQKYRMYGGALGLSYQF